MAKSLVDDELWRLIQPLVEAIPNKELIQAQGRFRRLAHGALQ